jgi:predicted RNA-binding Zn-ribbon protein involved in translation (DUF1610 family)
VTLSDPMITEPAQTQAVSSAQTAVEPFPAGVAPDASLQVQPSSEHYVRHCPKCGSMRVHRSRRRGPVERLLAAFGASICRCHDCRARQAWFGISPIPIGNADPDAVPWLATAFVVSGVFVSLVIVWLFIERFGQGAS